MKSLIALFSLFFIIAATLFFGSPYYNAYELKKAYDAHDGQAVVNRIDFKQLQPNISTQLTNKFANTLQQYPVVAQLGGDKLT